MIAAVAGALQITVVDLVQSTGADLRRVTGRTSGWLGGPVALAA